MTGATSEAAWPALALVPLAGYLLVDVKKWPPNERVTLTRLAASALTSSRKLAQVTRGAFDRGTRWHPVGEDEVNRGRAHRVAWTGPLGRQGARGALYRGRGHETSHP